jgi:hypothetical protein
VALSGIQAHSALCPRRPVQCPNTACDVTLPRDELQAHRDEQCVREVVACPQEGCEVRVQRGNLAGHLAVCAHRLEACGYGCGANVALSGMQAHKALCPRRPVQCPNTACDVTLPRDELQAHRDEQCPHEEVACPHAAALGCAHRCARRDMAAHSADGLAHFAGMMGRMATLQTKAQQQQISVNLLQTTVQQQQATAQLQKLAVNHLQATVQEQQTTIQHLEKRFTCIRPKCANWRGRTSD